jgi:hypothetical protein
MNGLCLRCLLDEVRGSYCPQCGRALAVPKRIPAVTELQALEEQIAVLLPRLRRVHASLDQIRSEAMKHRQFSRVQLIEKRQMFLLRAEQRLEEHLRFVQRELSARNRASSGPSLA